MGEQGVNKRDLRLGEVRQNNQGTLMTIIDYIDATDITVKLDNKHQTIIYHNTYKNFKNGLIKDPYYPSLYGVGIIGEKYQSRINYKLTKEYSTWQGILSRCYNNKKKNAKSYKQCRVCDEWLLFENFYEWLHSQENFGKWYNGDKWDVDKDILVKGNKIYSPETCCLVPTNVNILFVKRKEYRGELPIGVVKHRNKYVAQCHRSNQGIYIGIYDTPEEAFQAYKEYKESYIKQVAQEEYSKGNITKQCYDAMINYKVEITD